MRRVYLVFSLLAVVAAVQLPPFMDNASIKARQQYTAIGTNENLNKSEKDALVEELMAGESSEVQKAFGQFREKVNEHYGKAQKYIEEQLAKMRGTTREALNNLHKLHIEDLKDNGNRAKEYFEGLDGNIKKEIGLFNIAMEEMIAFVFLFLFKTSEGATLKEYDLTEVSIDPPPKPCFLINATHDVIEQFMAIYRTPAIGQLRKVSELDVLVGTLRPVVQQSYQNYKAEAILLKLSQDERLQEITEKAHYTMAHLSAMSLSNIGRNEKKKRTELMFEEFSTFLVEAVTDEVGNSVNLIMKQMLRALLFTEKMIQK
ncbi:unnamed protein product [Auanema sp. JU1783]|nr:unnamed protein product [Auanema sp. JU1783]